MSTTEFAKYTEKIRSMLPFWFQMKKQPNDSLGLQFLNFFGMEFDDIKKIMEYAYRQTKIDSTDEKFVDIVYRAMLPTYFDMTEFVADDVVKPKKINKAIAVIGDTIPLIKTDKLYNFFQLHINYELDNAIFEPDYYFVDMERKILYTRIPFGGNIEKPNGEISLTLKDGSVQTYDLSIHHVWNFFDEFGALLSCPRLYGEKNHEYKQRILDVFRNPANSTKLGIANGISRELGMRVHKTWVDPTEEFIIKEKMVLVNEIKVGDEVVDLDDVYVTPEGYIVLNSRAYDTRTNIDVSYICGVEIRALTDHTDNKFSNETIKANGMPTDLMLGYVSNIKQNSSVLWNDFKYNEGMWVKDDSEYENKETFGFVPATYDSNIKGFEKLGFFNRGC